MKPTDQHGRELKVGDLVMVPCVVENVRERAGYNVGLRTVHTLDVDSDHKISFALASRQVELVELVDAVEEQAP